MDVPNDRAFNTRRFFKSAPVCLDLPAAAGRSARAPCRLIQHADTQGATGQSGRRQHASSDHEVPSVGTAKLQRYSTAFLVAIQE